MAQEDWELEEQRQDGELSDPIEGEDGEFQVIWQKSFQIGDVGETVRAGVAKTGYAMKNAKAYTALKWDIMDLQTRRKRKLLLVGKLVYATHTGKPTDSDVLEKALLQVDALTKELREKEAELSRICGVRFCPGCGSTEELSHVYCSRCGRRLQDEEQS